MITKAKLVVGVMFGLYAVLAWSAMAPAYDEITVTNGGTVRGTVKFDGSPPKLPALQITKYKEVCRDVPNESLVLGTGKGIRYAVVTLEGISKGKAVEKEVVHEIDNIKCRFVPHVIAASVGQFVLFKNSDPILHTAHAYFTANQPQFNIGLYPGRVSRKPLVAPGVAKIICEVHPWMSAYIVVTDHPYQAVTDLYGEYLINDVPPGSYRVKIWHEMLGTEEKPVEVKAGAATVMDFILNANSGAKK
ncbi:MAG TPA: carboxypeptidase regulatory-like domain-containing protein [Candidatus Binatia bacterium]|jgi:plastocyanin